MKTLYSYIISIALSLVFVNTLNAQETILSSIAYGSDKDSIQISDYTTGSLTHLIVIPSDDCDDCSQYYSSYQQEKDRWLQDFNLHVTMIAKRNQGLASVESQVDLLETLYGLDVLLWTTSMSNSLTLLVNEKLSDPKLINGLLTVEEVDSELQNLNTQEEANSFFDQHLLQCLTDLNQCDESNLLVYTCGEIEINEFVYTEVSAYNLSYFLRESSGGQHVFLYDEQSQSDKLLLDYTARQCDTLTLYSVLTSQYQTFIVDDYSCNEGVESLSLNLPFACEQNTENFTLISDQGTNAGLIPLFDEAAVYSRLNCHYEDSILTMGEEENCPVDKPDDLSMLRIYPNPTNGVFSINAGWVKVEVIGLFSLDGKRIEVIKDSNNMIDITHLASGMYVVGIEKNSRASYHKIVKY